MPVVESNNLPTKAIEPLEKLATLNGHSFEHEFRLTLEKLIFMGPNSKSEATRRIRKRFPGKSKVSR